MNKSKPIIEEAVKELYDTLLPECLMIADMGCSSGRNSFQMVSDIVAVAVTGDVGHRSSPPSFSVFLNDRFENDFGALFRSIPDFVRRVEAVNGGGGSCFVSVTPKSFYGRVFPDRFLHFVHSSYCLHYLSQVPKELMNEEGEALNKGSICRTHTSSPKVVEAYSNQFRADFSEFLKSRAVEMVPGGHMVLTFMGSTNGYDPYNVFDLLGSTLYDMVLEGVIEEEKVDKFNVPFYRPTIEEVKDLVGEVEESHSLFIKKVETFTAEWSIDPTRELAHRAKVVAMYTRAGIESILTDVLKLDGTVLDDLFMRYEVKVKQRLAVETCEHFGFVVWITKKV